MANKLSTEMVQLLGNYGHIGFTFVAAIFIGLGAVSIWMNIFF